MNNSSRGNNVIQRGSGGSNSANDHFTGCILSRSDPNKDVFLQSRSQRS
jgi:hypothetical protein